MLPLEVIYTPDFDALNFFCSGVLAGLFKSNLQIAEDTDTLIISTEYKNIGYKFTELFKNAVQIQ